MASTTAQDVTQGLEGNSRSLEHHSEMHWGPPMKFTNVGCRPCARPSESPLCNPTQCPASQTHTAIPPGDIGHGGPGMKWSPVLTCRTVGRGWVGWEWSEPHGSNCTFRIIFQLRKNANKLQQPSNIFQDTNHIYYTSEKTQVVSTCTEHNSVYTYCVDGAYRFLLRLRWMPSPGRGAGPRG